MKSKLFIGLFVLILVAALSSVSYAQCCGSKASVKCTDKEMRSSECSSTKADMKKAYSYEYKGKTYYFDTSKLMDEFKADPEAKLNQVSSTCCAEKMTLDKRSAAKSTYNEKEYYFCNDKCKAAFDADPKAYLQKANSMKCGDKCCGSKEANKKMTKTSEI